MRRDARKRCLVLAVAGLLLATYLPSRSVSSQQPARPNVLFAIADD